MASGFKMWFAIVRRIVLAAGLLSAPIGSSPAAAQSQAPAQVTSGGCSPVIVNKVGNVEITASCGLPSAALEALQKRLAEELRNQNNATDRAELTKQLNEQAEDFERRYRELQKLVDQRTVRDADRIKMKELIEEGNFKSAEALLQTTVSREFGVIPIRIDFGSTDASLLGALRSAWKEIAVALSVSYAIAFIMLLLATRRYSWAFRVLSDKAWAKWLTWPFFLIRHIKTYSAVWISLL